MTYVLVTRSGKRSRAPDAAAAAAAAGSLVVSGSGFGSKSTVAPVYFNTFEAETVGDAAQSATTPIAGLEVLDGGAGEWTHGISTTQKHSGTKSIRVIYPVGHSGFPKLGSTLPAGSLSCYASCWVYWNGASGGSPLVRVWKWPRIGCGVVYAGAPKCYATIPITSGSANDVGVVQRTGVVDVDDGIIQFGGGGGDLATALTKGVWHFFEINYKLSTPAVANGIYQVKVDGTAWVDETALETRSVGMTDTLAWAISVFDGADEVTVETCHLYADEMLIDNSHCRVIVTNNAAYTSSTKFAPQSLTTWSATQITATTPNWSDLPSGAAWAHVWDSSNAYIGAFAVTVP